MTVLISQCKFNYILDMGRVGEHVHRLYGFDLIFRVEQCKVACLSGRVTAYVDDAMWTGIQNHFHHILVHACSWGIDYHDIGMSVLLDE